MESIIEKVEHTRHREQVTVAAQPSSAQVQLLMNLEVSAPEQAPQPLVEQTSSTHAGPPLAFNPMFDANQSNLGTSRGGGGRGGAWGGRGRGGQGGDGMWGVGRRWLADRPVRCPNKAPPGSFCSFPNYQEAEKCGKCGVKNPIISSWTLRVTHHQTTSAAAMETGEAEVRDIGNGRGEEILRGGLAIFFTHFS
jgi:hypothetical protein